MAKKKSQKKFLKSKLVYLVFIALLIIGLGCVTVWINTTKFGQASKTESRIDQECMKRLKEKYSAPEYYGLADVEDYTECDPDWVPQTSLTKEQIEENNRNAKIRREAVNLRSIFKCNEIKGATYYSLPTNVTKVKFINDSDAQESCRQDVRDSLR